MSDATTSMDHDGDSVVDIATTSSSVEADLQQDDLEDDVLGELGDLDPNHAHISMVSGQMSPHEYFTLIEGDRTAYQAQVQGMSGRRPYTYVLHDRDMADEIIGYLKRAVEHYDASYEDCYGEKESLKMKVQTLEQQLGDLKNMIPASRTDFSKLTNEEFADTYQAMNKEAVRRMQLLSQCCLAVQDKAVVADVAGTDEKPLMICPQCNRLATSNSVQCKDMHGRQACCPFCRKELSADSGWYMLDATNLSEVPRVPTHLL
jgi:hypothetical protein